MENITTKQWVSASTIEISNRLDLERTITLLKEYYKENIRNIKKIKTLNNKWVITFEYLKTV